MPQFERSNSDVSPVLLNHKLRERGYVLRMIQADVLERGQFSPLLEYQCFENGVMLFAVRGERSVLGEIALFGQLLAELEKIPDYSTRIDF